jgi:hypothetical protein
MEALMPETINIKEMDARIKSLRKTAEELKAMSGEFPALYRNVSRVLASVKMLELNVPDTSA